MIILLYFVWLVWYTTWIDLQMLKFAFLKYILLIIVYDPFNALLNLVC